MMVTLDQLYVAPGHNFFGHHGGPAGEHPTVPAAELRCVAGRGIVGDRFFDYRPDYPGQVTFFSAEVLEELIDALGAPWADPAALRRNVLVCGVDLMALVGEEFSVQGVRFRGACECKPCYWMDTAIAPGAEAWLRGRGGLRARILTDGVLVPGAAEFAGTDAALKVALPAASVG
jgi:MOSC domain-containing protein YiiM